MRKLLAVLLLMLMLSVPVHSAFDSSQVEEALPESAGEIMDGMGAESTSIEGIFAGIGDYIKNHIKAELTDVLRPVGAVVAASMLCSVGEGLQLKKDIDYVNLAGCLVIAVAAIGDVDSVAAMGRQAIGEMHDFSRVLLPVLCTAAAGAGAVSSAAAKYAATALFLDVLISLTLNFLLPLQGAYLAALVASSATGDGRLKGAVKLMKWLCKISMTALVSVFSFYLGLSGIAASGVDAAAAKTAKAVISSFVPVVGKMISGASESLVAGAGIIRNAIGLFGLGAVLAVCAAPFLAIGLRYLLFKAAAAIVGLIAGDRIAALVDGISGAYGMLLGLVGCSAIFMFISILLLIRTVV